MATTGTKSFHIGTDGRSIEQDVFPRVLMITERLLNGFPIETSYGQHSIAASRLPILGATTPA